MGVRNKKQEELRRLDAKTLDARFLNEIQNGLNCSPFEAEAVPETNTVCPAGVIALEAREKAEPYSNAHCCFPIACRNWIEFCGSRTAVRSIAQWLPSAGPRPMPVLAGIDWRVPFPISRRSVKNLVLT